MPHRRCRELLKQFTSAGLPIDQYGEMMSLLHIHVAELVHFIQHVTQHCQTTRYYCAKEWTEFVRSLAASSPLCALVHPSEITATLISDMCERDIRKDVSSMKCLQEEIPCLFTAIRSSNSYPLKSLQPLLQSLIKIANIPFSSDVGGTAPVALQEDKATGLSWFPLLSTQRKRQHYEADSKNRLLVCTKKHSRHPSLLPGGFTLFCEHGEYDVILTL